MVALTIHLHCSTYSISYIFAYVYLKVFFLCWKILIESLLAFLTFIIMIYDSRIKRNNSKNNYLVAPYMSFRMFTLKKRLSFCKQNKHFSLDTENMMLISSDHTITNDHLCLRFEYFYSCFKTFS